MIKRVDRLILKDITGPWLFAVGLFASLLMAATYLGRIAGFIVDGVPPITVLKLTALLFPPILTKTFTMSVLLATLLGFSRLSGDSELVALRAAGASIYRIVAPVFGFSLTMAIATFVFNESFVPMASREYQKTTTEMLKNIKVRDPLPIALTHIEGGKLQFVIAAKDVNSDTKAFHGVSMISYDDKGDRNYLLFCDTLSFKEDSLGQLMAPGGTVDPSAFNWQASGNVTLATADFSSITKIPDHVWPKQLAQMDQTFDQVTEPKDQDFDKFTMKDLGAYIALHKKERDMTPKMLHNYEYGYWSKIAVPLGAVMFGILGAVLGIRNSRSGAAAGYGLAIGITFLSVLLANIMNVWAGGGVIPAWFAAFTPIVIGSIASGVIMWRRNG